MKPMNSYLNHDQNWHWPENTWFRERLNALKARENEQRRKIVGSTRPGRVAAPSSSEKDELKVG